METYNNLFDLEQYIYNIELKEAFNKVLLSLSPSEAYILKLRFYEKLTVDQVAKIIGCKTARLIQVEKQILRKIRFTKIAGFLSDFV